MTTRISQQIWIFKKANWAALNKQVGGLTNDIIGKFKSYKLSSHFDLYTDF